MSWINGQQTNRCVITPEKEWERQYALEGFLEEDVAKRELYKFFRNNISFSARTLIGVDLYPIQSIIIKTMFERDYILNIIGRGGSKSFLSGVFAALYAMMIPNSRIGILSSSFRQCLTGDALVSTENGLCRLEDIKEGTRILSVDGTNLVKKKWKNETSDGLRITSKRGYSITGKKEHRCLVLDTEKFEIVYKEIKDLKQGDYLIISPSGVFGDRNIVRDFNEKFVPNNKQNPLYLENDGDLFYYLGLLWGDGHIDVKLSKFTITTADEEIVNFLERYLSKVSPESRITKYEKRKGCINFPFSSRIFSEFLKSIGITENQKAISKKIPNGVLESKKENLAAFLSGLFDTDGVIHRYKKSKGCCIDFCTSSPEMAKQVHYLLLQYGILSKLCTEEAQGKIKICGIDTIGRESYKVRITDRDSFELFKSLIGFRLSRKQDILDKVLIDFKRKNSKKFIPSPSKFVEAKYKEDWGRKIFSNKDSLSPEEFIRLVDRSYLLDNEDKDRLRKVAESGFYFDRVEKIEEVRDIITYDIEVDNEHCYWGNGFINHNSKHIFRYIEKFASDKKGKFFADCINKVNKSNDEWSMEIGSSSITAIPLGDGSKLRGFRFTVLLIDELLLMPQKILNEVILPFISVVPNPTERDKIKDAEDWLIQNSLMEEKDRYVWPNNKFIGLSSASYAFEYLYELYKIYENLIVNGSSTAAILEKMGESKENKASRAIIHLSYEALPPGQYEQSALENFKETMSESQFGRELCARFTDDSSGFFRISKMNLCTVPDGDSPSIEVKGDPEAEYIISIDPSWAENDTSDHFAMQVLKLDREKQIATLVHSYALAGAKLKNHIRYFLYLLQNFNTVMVWCDYAGGVQFINSCNESELFKSRGIQLSVMEEEFQPDEKYLENVAKGKREYSKENRKFVVFRNFNSDWIRKGNELLQANFDRKKIWFGAKTFNETYLKQLNKSIPIDELEFLEEAGYSEKGQARQIDLIERQHQLLDLTKAECALIQIKTNPQGSQVFDLPETIKRTSGPNRTRKDSYTALVIGSWGAKVYFDMMNSKQEAVFSGFTPFRV